MQHSNFLRFPHQYVARKKKLRNKGLKDFTLCVTDLYNLWVSLSEMIDKNAFLNFFRSTCIIHKTTYTGQPLNQIRYQTRGGFNDVRGLVNVYFKKTFCYDSSASKQDEITCWCLTKCLTSHHSHTCHTPGSKRFAEGSPASSCPGQTVAFPGTWRLCLPFEVWPGLLLLMCWAFSSMLECLSCPVTCHWCPCLHGDKWKQ